MTHAFPDLGFVVGPSFERSATAYLDVINPATETVVARLPVASHDIVNEALEQARIGFGRWSLLPGHIRGTSLVEAARSIRAQADVIANALTLENGKPLAEAQSETLVAADTLEWFGHEASRLHDILKSGQIVGSRYLVERRPIGVVAAFTPWNFPVLTTMRKIAPALAAGCSVIVKPAEETPGAVLSALRLLAERLPIGVLNVLYGNPAEISNLLIASPVVRKISITGSTAVGRTLASLAAVHVKPITLELGGHAPVIVDRSVDAIRVAKAAVSGKFRASGQICTSPTRFFIHSEKYDEVVAEFTRLAEALVVGDGMDPNTQMGPLVNSRRLEHIEGLVQDAVSHGGHLRTGGIRQGNVGYFYRPTVLEHVPRTARIQHEEPFGPVALMASFGDIDEAISSANDTPYGLAGYVFGDDMEQARSVASRLEAGVIGINSFSVSAPNIPFGGVKASGYGVEGGRESIEGYTVPVTTHERAAEAS